MARIIDYAGLFPPAGLPLEKAIRNYADYRKSREAWMLSRFIIPHGKLSELTAFSELMQEGEPFSFSVLGSATGMHEQYLDELDALLQDVEAFHKEHGERVATEVMEIKLPHEAAVSGRVEEIRHVLDDTAKRLDRSPYRPKYVFFEPLFEESWEQDLPSIFRALREHNEAVALGDWKDYNYAGLKMRCGGVKASLFPSVDQLARVLEGVRDYGIAFKATAGLHHPVRHYHEPVNTDMFGFLNVFGAGLLAYAHALSIDEITEIVRDKDPDSFRFTEETFAWKELEIPADEIEQLREVALISYGSCSFDEPRDDLRQMNLL